MTKILQAENPIFSVVYDLLNNYESILEMSVLIWKQPPFWLSSTMSASQRKNWQKLFKTASILLFSTKEATIGNAVCRRVGRAGQSSCACRLAEQSSIRLRGRRAGRPIVVCFARESRKGAQVLRLDTATSLAISVLASESLSSSRVGANTRALLRHIGFGTYRTGSASNSNRKFLD